MNKISKILITALTTLFIGVIFWSVLNAQAINDWFRLYNYEPPAKISALAVEASFTDEGTRLFYVHYPELLDKNNFQGKCSQSEETIVLGCYISQEKIYVFDVVDDRLEGVEQVTSAHEMLHAVYDRLSDAEKAIIDKQVNEYYEKSTDERLKKTVESYRAKDPTIVGNELHSILGTEIRDLPPELEVHYSKYFIDRGVVVTLSEAYEAEFTKREDLINSYDEQLSRLSATINDQEAQVVLLGSALQSEQAQLDRIRSNTDAYNAAVPLYNQKVRDYNRQLEKLKTDIASYNEIVVARNAIAVEEQQLVEAIDSRALEL